MDAEDQITALPGQRSDKVATQRSRATWFLRAFGVSHYSIDFFNGGENDCAELSGHDLLRRPVPISKYEFGASSNVSRKVIVEGHRRTRTYVSLFKVYLPAH